MEKASYKALMGLKLSLLEQCKWDCLILGYVLMSVWQNKIWLQKKGMFTSCSSLIQAHAGITAPHYDGHYSKIAWLFPELSWSTSLYGWQGTRLSKTFFAKTLDFSAGFSIRWKSLQMPRQIKAKNHGAEYVVYVWQFVVGLHLLLSLAIYSNTCFSLRLIKSNLYILTWSKQHDWHHQSIFCCYLDCLIPLECTWSLCYGICNLKIHRRLTRLCRLSHHVSHRIPFSQPQNKIAFNLCSSVWSNVICGDAILFISLLFRSCGATDWR